MFGRYYTQCIVRGRIKPGVVDTIASKPMLLSPIREMLSCQLLRLTQKAVHDELQWYATWFPNGKVKVGDVGVVARQHLHP